MGATLGSAYGFLLARIFPAPALTLRLFAVAGMAGLIGGSTGAALAAIVMIFEMTLDYNVIIPDDLDGGHRLRSPKAAFEREYLYFQAGCGAVTTCRSLWKPMRTFFRRARDVMNTRIAVVPDSPGSASFARRAAEQPEVEYFLIGGSGKITAVCPRGKDPVQKFSTLAEDMTLIDSLERLHRANAALALVSVRGDAAAASVKGVITRQQVADALAEAVERYDDDV